MICAACGATNSDSADWCGQCYATLAAEVPTPPPAASPPDAPSPADSEPGERASPEHEPGEPTAEGFRRRDGVVEWECPSCGQWSAVTSLACGACGTTIAARWENAEAERAAAGRRLAEPWTAAFALSAVVPGAGHIGLARYSTGLARAVLYAVWLVGGVAMWRAGGALAGGPLVLGAVVLWAGTLADVAALRAGRRELLGGRGLLWLVVGVLVALFVGVFAAAAGAPGRAVLGVG